MGAGVLQLLVHGLRVVVNIHHRCGADGVEVTR